MVGWGKQLWGTAWVILALPHYNAQGISDDGSLAWANTGIFHCCLRRCCSPAGPRVGELFPHTPLSMGKHTVGMRVRCPVCNLSISHGYLQGITGVSNCTGRQSIKTTLSLAHPGLCMCLGHLAEGRHWGGFLLTSREDCKVSLLAGLSIDGKEIGFAFTFLHFTLSHTQQFSAARAPAGSRAPVGSCVLRKASSLSKRHPRLPCPWCLEKGSCPVALPGAS